MIYCYNMKCKYCNDKYKCTNKKVELEYHGVNTKYQGFQNYLKCKSYEEHPLYEKAMELVRKMEENKWNNG